MNQFENTTSDKNPINERKGAVFDVHGLTFHWACSLPFSIHLDLLLVIADLSFRFLLSPLLNMKNIFPVLFVIINVLLHGQVICYICKDITSTSALHRLKQYLFCDYDREVIPEEKNGTKIDFGLSIQHYNVVSIFFFFLQSINKSKIINFFLLYSVPCSSG